MMEWGTVDPAKVTRTALQNAASIGSLILMTEAVVAEKPEEKKAPRPPPAAWAATSVKGAINPALHRTPNPEGWVFLFGLASTFALAPNPACRLARCHENAVLLTFICICKAEDREF
ncbi:MAG: hypothetical protein KatS3mg072_2221 [Meiothermus sp.]|nr:MAG: hypothetical protein KatS3mg072_2221 [Meiothermus sp.]